MALLYSIVLVRSDGVTVTRALKLKQQKGIQPSFTLLIKLVLSHAKTPAGERAYLVATGLEMEMYYMVLMTITRMLCYFTISQSL